MLTTITSGSTDKEWAVVVVAASPSVANTCGNHRHGSGQVVAKANTKSAVAEATRQPIGPGENLSQPVFTTSEEVIPGPGHDHGISRSVFRPVTPLPAHLSGRFPVRARSDSLDRLLVFSIVQYLHCCPSGPVLARPRSPPLIVSASLTVSPRCFVSSR